MENIADKGLNVEVAGGSFSRAVNRDGFLLVNRRGHSIQRLGGAGALSGMLVQVPKWGF